MALLDAKEYDPRPAQRRRRLAVILIVVALALFILWWFFRYYPEKQAINRFFQAIEHKDFDKAYALYFADPNWKQHPQKYDQYPISQFTLDWGPSSEYGEIKSHRVDCAVEPPKKGFASPSGVIVVVSINNRAETTSMWVQKNDKSISLSPQTVLCHEPR